MQIEHRARAFGGRRQQSGALQREPRLHQSRDRQAVPRGHHFVVAAGLRPLRPRRQQRRAHPVESHRVLGVVAQLQHRRTTFERARGCHAEKRCRPVTVVDAESLAELIDGPGIRQPLDPRGVGVQRRHEHAVGAQVVEHETCCLPGDPVRERITAATRPVRVDAQQQSVVVEHLLEVRHHPGGVDAVAGEAAGQLVVQTTAGHRRTGALHRGQCGRVCSAFVVAQQRFQQGRGWELGGRAETTMDGVLVGEHRSDGAVTQLRLDRRAPARKSGGHGPQFVADVVAGLLDLGPAGAPRRPATPRTPASGNRCRRRRAGHPG